MESEEEAKPTPRINKDEYVPRPDFGEDGPQSALIYVKRRSQEKLFKETLRITERRVHNFLKYADKFRVDFTVQELVDDLQNTKSSEIDQMCEELLGPNQPSRCFSAQFYSKDNEPLFFYLAERWADGKPCVCKIRPLTLNLIKK